MYLNPPCSYLLLLCWLAAAAKTAFVVGADDNGVHVLTIQNKDPDGSTPLEICQGECERHEDCRTGLSCFRRFGNEPVPGCRDGDDESHVPPASFCVLARPGMLINYGQTSARRELGPCQGHCFDDTDCLPGHECFQRQANDSVPGCEGGDLYGAEVNFCVSKSKDVVYLPDLFDTSVALADDAQPLVFKGEFPSQDVKPLRWCEGHCASDQDCRAGLFCFNRSAHEPVPGCSGGEKDASKSNYCVAVRDRPPQLGNFAVAVPTPVVAPVPSPEAAPMEGPVQKEPVDSPAQEPVDSPAQEPVNTPAQEPVDSPAQEPVKSPEEDADTPMEPTGPHEPIESTANPSSLPALRNFGSTPPRYQYPLMACEGDCDEDHDCSSGLYCHKRLKAFEPVPGCYGGEQDSSRTDYCAVGDSQPTQPPYFLPTPPEGEITYKPGKLTTMRYEILLSEGLDTRRIAVSHEPVRYHDGTFSEQTFHGRPDAAAVFADPRPGHEGEWAYVSNSEEPEDGAGGVGAIYFDREGQIIDYKILLTGTTMNCGGGRTPWGTWMTNEEYNKGRVWQVDPFGTVSGGRPPEPAIIGDHRGAWESFAFDIRDTNRPVFFATEDNPAGALARYSPLDPNWDDPWSIMRAEGAVEYLVLVTSEGNSDHGNFFWSEDRSLAKASAAALYPGSEGIDCKDGMLYFVCKTVRMLFILDLDAGTWTRKSTLGGLFDGTPDQVKRIVGDTRDMLYLTEEATLNAGIHARDDKGRYYVVLESPVLPGETTGLAFSPDGRYLFVAYQDTGKLFMVWRRDGLPFQAEKLDVKYHHVS